MISLNVLCTFHFLRQQREMAQNSPHYSLADYCAPKETALLDYVGGFATTMGYEVEQFAKTFEDAGDDYSQSLLRPLETGWRKPHRDPAQKGARILWVRD